MPCAKLSMYRKEIEILNYVRFRFFTFSRGSRTLAAHTYAKLMSTSPKRGGGGGGGMVRFFKIV